MTKIRHLTSIADLTKSEILAILKFAVKLKKSSKTSRLAHGKTLAMIFEKPSLRTRLSFEIGMTQLGGHAIYLSPADIQMGKRESVSDVAKVISSQADIIMARTFKHETIVELAKYSSVPVINGLSDLEHPCQILADLMTILEIRKSFKNLTIAFVGDYENNVTHSWVIAGAILGINFKCAFPKGYGMKKEMVIQAKQLGQQTGFTLTETTDPKQAVKTADVVITDTWISMGDESEKNTRLKVFKPYQVNSKLMSYATNDAIFMHCLPAYRNYEVTSKIIDGNQSVVWQEAENRLHVQKALILFCLNKFNQQN